jgi:DNA-binding transcriptional LysR family regulator
MNATPSSPDDVMRGTQFAELTAFVAVAEHRNFTKAAAHLGLSTSTLSQTVRSFEERLGVRLLNRTTRSVALTEAGERLLSNAQPVLEGVHNTIESVNAFRDKPIGTLRLNIPRAAAMVLVGPLLPEFLAKFPEVKLEVEIDDGHSDIVSGRFDAGVGIGERIGKDMIAVRILDEFRVIAVASPAYLEHHPRPETPEDLRAHNCIRLRQGWDGSIQPWAFESAGRRIEVAVEGSLVLNDTYLVTNAVLDGIGVGYIAEPLIGLQIQDGQLIPLLGDWCGHLSGLFLYYPSGPQIPGPLRAFADFMRERCNIVMAGRSKNALPDWA